MEQDNNGQENSEDLETGGQSSVNTENGESEPIAEEVKFPKLEERHVFPFFYASFDFSQGSQPLQRGIFKFLAAHGVFDNLDPDRVWKVLSPKRVPLPDAHLPMSEEEIKKDALLMKTRLWEVIRDRKKLIRERGGAQNIPKPGVDQELALIRDMLQRDRLFYEVTVRKRDPAKIRKGEVRENPFHSGFRRLFVNVSRVDENKNNRVVPEIQQKMARTFSKHFENIKEVARVYKKIEDREELSDHELEVISESDITMLQAASEYGFVVDYWRNHLPKDEKEKDFFTPDEK